MRIVHSTRGTVALLLVTACLANAADRHWQTGTWKDMGLTRDPWVGGGVAPLGTGGTAIIPVMPEVGTYVIETPEMRLELEDTAPLAGRSFDASVTIGASVTFAVAKNMAYIRDADGTEHRLKITKKISTTKR